MPATPNEATICQIVFIFPPNYYLGSAGFTGKNETYLLEFTRLLVSPLHSNGYNSSNKVSKCGNLQEKTGINVEFNVKKIGANTGFIYMHKLCFCSDFFYVVF